MAAESFWDFSVKHYDLPGVADACLALQDRYDLDVNLLLFCLWYGHQQGEFDDALLRDIAGFSGQWADQVVKPLRRARRWIRKERTRLGLPSDQLEQLRTQIKALELRAEHLQQDHLELLSTAHVRASQRPDRKAVRQNLKRYLHSKGIDNNGEIDRLLDRLLAGLDQSS